MGNKGFAFVAKQCFVFTVNSLIVCRTRHTLLNTFLLRKNHRTKYIKKLIINGGPCLNQGKLKSNVLNIRALCNTCCRRYSQTISSKKKSHPAASAETKVFIFWSKDIIFIKVDC